MVKQHSGLRKAATVYQLRSNGVCLNQCFLLNCCLLALVLARSKLLSLSLPLFPALHTSPLLPASVQNCSRLVCPSADSSHHNVPRRHDSSGPSAEPSDSTTAVGGGGGPEHEDLSCHSGPGQNPLGRDCIWGHAGSFCVLAMRIDISSEHVSPTCSSSQFALGRWLKCIEGFRIQGPVEMRWGS